MNTGREPETLRVGTTRLAARRDRCYPRLGVRRGTNALGLSDFAWVDHTETRMTPIEPHPRQLGLSDYLAILDRRKWVIIQSTLIVAVVAFILSAQQEKVFGASAEVLLSRQNLSNVITGVTSPDVYVDPERFAQTQAGLARAPAVAERAIEESELTSRTPGELLASSSVRPRGNADLLLFTVEDREPAVATRLANAYATAFTEYKADLDTGQLTQARADLERRIAELRRDGQSGSELYRELVDSAQQLRTMELLQTRNLVVRPATGAGQIAPTPNRNAVLGAFVGLLLGLGIAFLWETLDKRVRTEEEIERRLDGLPLLSRLPEPPRHLEKEGLLAMIHDPQDAYAEAIRRLRTNLEFANVDRRAKVIMATSAVEREGKSTTIANLAVALARSGRNVALVDLDLRQPVIAGFFGLEGKSGITDVVLERIDLRAALVPVQLPVKGASFTGNRSIGAAGRMSVLPTGRLPANPGELIGTQALGRVLDQLRADHDYVLLDSAPLLSVGDSMTLSARTDAILVVTRLGIVNRTMLLDLSRELAGSPAAKLGFVVTGVDIKAGYGYGYGHAAPATSDERVAEVEPRRTARRGQRRAAAGS